ncbi:hypothetical protein EVAR_69608_1 [Eumeta japonica]|uniref:Uncharacterized protein n=1 Tax=Eumeta variegata TaxID=151549 RepID=A0A4C2A1L1_EUMVA|nr:hypothetical protein EVAR_69608_1 [Eumeta japonica]
MRSSRSGFTSPSGNMLASQLPENDTPSGELIRGDIESSGDLPRNCYINDLPKFTRESPHFWNAEAALEARGEGGPPAAALMAETSVTGF